MQVCKYSLHVVSVFLLIPLLLDLYYLGFPKDPIRNKIFVFTVYGLEVVQTIIITQSAFHVFGSGYGNFSAYDQINLAWFTVPILSGMGMYLALFDKGIIGINHCDKSRFHRRDVLCVSN